MELKIDEGKLTDLIDRHVLQPAAAEKLADQALLHIETAQVLVKIEEVHPNGMILYAVSGLGLEKVREQGEALLFLGRMKGDG